MAHRAITPAANAPRRQLHRREIVLLLICLVMPTIEQRRYWRAAELLRIVKRMHRGGDDVIGNAGGDIDDGVATALADQAQNRSACRDAFSIESGGLRSTTMPDGCRAAPAAASIAGRPDLGDFSRRPSMPTGSASMQ